MFRVFGNPKRLCDGLRRRDLLEVGGIGLAGLSLPRLLSANATQPEHREKLGRTFGKAKNCILIFLYGSPSQLETFDIKPEAPVEIRGDLGFIPSSIPGYRVGELLPHTSKIMDKVTVVRSMTHPYPIHGVAFATTGIPTMDVQMELSPRDGRHWPYFGSVVDFMDDRASGGKIPEVPRNLALPWPMSTRRRGEVYRAGPYPAFLGPAYQPVWTQFEGEGTKPIPKTLRDETIFVNDPYVGIKPDYAFELAGAGLAPAEITLDRLDRRRSLAEQLDEQQRRFDQHTKDRSYDRFQQMAYSLLSTPKLRTALDTSKEPMAIRESYGMTLFGQSCLTARRLVEAGSRLVSVFWDEYGLAGSGWDTHWEHYPRMKDELMPPFDIGFAGLILDLERRGLMDETLVVVLSEHGRTPKVNKAKGGGRDHWSNAYSIVLAGAGVPRGSIIGKTDKIAGEVLQTPVSPKDVLATMYHLLGIDPHAIFYDRLGRPLELAGPGIVRPELLA